MSSSSPDRFAFSSLVAHDLANLTIELDMDPISEIEDIICTHGSSPSSFPHPHIGPSRKAEDVVYYVMDTIPIRSLPSTAKEILSNQLQLPSLSTMKNWESLAGVLGFSQDEIMGISRMNNMIYVLLSRILDRPLNDLLHGLVNISRVDTLSSLRPILMNIRNEDLSPSTSTYPSSLLSHTMSSPFISILNNDRSERDEEIEMMISQYEPFIFIVHYERSKEEVKTWNWFLKNIKAKAEEKNVGVIHIGELLIGDHHIRRRLEDVYRRAQLILICINEEYKKCIVDRKGMGQEEEIQLVVYDWMNGEHMGEGQRNKRFRVILMKDTDRCNIPIGWATSTLWYRYPNNWNDIVERTFPSGHSSTHLQSIH